MPSENIEFPEIVFTDEGVVGGGEWYEREAWYDDSKIYLTRFAVDEIDEVLQHEFLHHLLEKLVSYETSCKFDNLFEWGASKVVVFEDQIADKGSREEVITNA